MSVGTRSASKCGFSKSLCAGLPETMTPLTPCQTKHNIPAIRETVGAAVHAAVRTTAIKTKTGTAAINAISENRTVIANHDIPTPIDPRSFAPKDRVLRAVKCR